MPRLSNVVILAVLDDDGVQGIGGHDKYGFPAVNLAILSRPRIDCFAYTKQGLHVLRVVRVCTLTVTLKQWVYLTTVQNPEEAIADLLCGLLKLIENNDTPLSLVIAEEIDQRRPLQ